MGAVAAVVDAGTNLVVNIIMADAASDPASDGCFLVDVTNVLCGISWVYDPGSNTFSEPPSPAVEG